MKKITSQKAQAGMSERCIIVCNGDVSDYKWFKDQFNEAKRRIIEEEDSSSGFPKVKEGAFILCADGGTRHLRKIGIDPDLIIGDMDSSSEEDLLYFAGKNIPVKKFSCEKDFTDTELAFDTAVELGYRNILILACYGSRLDHSMSNIFLLKKAADIGIDCCIKNEENYLWMIKGPADKELRISMKPGGWKNAGLSLLSLSDTCIGVYTKGLKYKLEDAVMHLGSGTGISNEFINDNVKVGLEQGYLIVVLSCV